MKSVFKKSMAVAVLAAGIAVTLTTPPQANSAAQQTTGAYARRALAYQWLTNQLGLTDEQKAQAKAAYQAVWKNAKPLMEQLRQSREAMADAVKANNTAQIRQLAATQGTLIGQLAAARSESRAQFYQMLTPEQRAKLDTIEQNMRDRMQRRSQWMQQRRKESDQ